MTAARLSGTSLASAIAVLLFVVSIALVAILRPAPVVEAGLGTQVHAGLLEDDFYRRKVSAGTDFEIVFGGDSRVLYGISPQVVSRATGRARVLNFAFASADLVPDYLHALAGHVRTPGGMIVLGISPASLLRRDASGNSFEQFRKLNILPPEAVLLETFADVIRRFQPLPTLTSWRWYLPAWLTERARAFASAEAPSTPVRHRIVYRWREELWVEATISRRGDFDPHRDDYTIKDYVRLFQRWPVDRERVSALLEFVRDRRQAGVSLLAFRPPGSTDMTLVENGFGDFDEAAFVRDLERAGGSWIRATGSGLTTIDGCHLDSEGARRLSEIVGAEITRPPRVGPLLESSPRHRER